jgi:general secretion pathway protein C
MQDFLRRNFWIAHLAGIAVASWLVAGVATEVVATVALKAPAAKASKDPALAAPPVRGVKPESRVVLMATLIGHNIFDAEPRFFEESEEGAAEPEPKSIDVDVDLLGTLVSSKAEWSLATIRFQNSSKLVRIGTLLLERIEVADIRAHYIVLQEGALRKVVRLWDDKVAGKPGQPVAAKVATPIAAVGSDAFAKGVKKSGPYDYHIDRSMLEENLQDLTKLGMQARIVPNYEDGKYHGFRLVGIRPDSLYKAIGLESGDLVKRVNGRDIDTPNRAIELFDQLRTSPTISLDVERRGQKVTMTYSIK